MARRPRVVVPGQALHLIQRGNNRTATFFADADRRSYLDWLGELAPALGCALHAYVLMTNHVHLLLTPDRADAPAALMKALGQRYTQYVNRTYRRTGTLWEGRFRSCLAESDAYVLACSRYIDLNPVRAGMVALPQDYPWSSCRGLCGLHHDKLLRPHADWMALGGSDAARAAAYAALVDSALPPDTLAAIRQATNANLALGSERFAAEIAAALGRRVTPGQRGRPRKAQEAEG